MLGGLFILFAYVILGRSQTLDVRMEIDPSYVNV